MSQEEFQKLVLEKLSSIDSDMSDVKKRLSKIEDNQRVLIDQTANLTEMKQSIKDAGEILYKKIV